MPSNAVGGQAMAYGGLLPPPPRRPPPTGCNMQMGMLPLTLQG